ncbi:P-loop containing nucleoside triphosphate hydrolase protein [Ampelomyces quisqualis]|uniref:DNA 3'-5' helicase n=1 Tax=Ampelomyces quisqualis TaxID=50730 RepID=A0A6A5QGX0_AMPQU|nr:P-loop containing nucleoside triphosphate hydrolase protein [Ampelomyces quisqualis]
MDALLDGLNEAQRSAVTSPANVVQVLAPPGSGKTKTLTARVAYHVIHERLQPWNIVVCTFTIKAAKEMKERIKGFVGNKLEAKLILGTFHSVARRFLSRYGQEIGIDKNFGIADTNDSKAIIKRIVTRSQYTVEPSHARSRISRLKSKGISADQFRATSKNVNENEFANVYSSYEEHLKASNLLDYDDLLVRCVDLLKRHPSCVSTIQAVLIDEYQDTNNIQYELMKLLAHSTRRITIVGDPDQSIYSFRSAEIKNLFRMRDEFPESIVINLENNYRSSGCILNSALAVIEQDESRPQKALLATHGVGEPPTLRHLVSAQVEAKWTVEELIRTKTLAAGLLNYNDYAILLRSSQLSLQFERALGQAGVPYRMVAGTRFFDRAEIKIILDYLRVVSQPEHNDAVARVMNLPSRKVGDTTVKALLEEAEVKKVTLWKIVLDTAQGRRRPEAKISGPAQKGIEQFVNVILTAREKLVPADGDHCNLYDIIGHIIQKISFESYLKQTHKENWQDRWANVEELVAQATQMATAMANGEDINDDALPVVEGIQQRPDTGADILSKFLANVTLSSVTDQDNGEIEQVTISTIHAAKGLEWPVVFIPAMYDGSIPHSRAEDHDEERRLLYVGMTHLAQILRRPCPTADEINIARSQLERPEDDYWPATREEIDGDDVSWGTSWDDKPKGSGLNGAAGSKRRKLEVDDSVAVTMNRTSGFSMASTTIQNAKAGFTSARDLGNLQVMQREAERIRMLATAHDAEIGRSAYQADKKAEAKPALAQKVKPRAAGQGAITTFFAKRSTCTPSQEVEQSAPFIGPPSLQRSQSPLPNTTPLYDISNVQSITSRPPRPFQPLSVPDYKLRNRPMPSKPKRSDPAGMESTRYVLLSSSPTKPETEDPALGNEAKEPASPVKQSSSVTTTTSGFRAASTFHTTSMSQAQRKTLGTRRTMQGWSVKNSSMPKPRPS